MTQCARVYRFKVSSKKSFWAQAPKLTMLGVIFLSFFIYFYASVQRNVIYTADIHYFKTTEFEYAKRALTFKKMKAMCYNGLNL